MVGMGTIANVLAIVSGGAVGLLARGGLKEHYQDGILKALGLATLFLGMAVAFAVSLLVIRFLMRYIQRHDFKAFGWYRIALGLLVLLVCALR